MHESPPTTTSHENALLTANRLDDSDGTQIGALYTASGHLVPESVRQVDRSDVHLPASPSHLPRPTVVVGKYNHPGCDTWIDEAIFGGHVMSGWGHTITETLSTAWACSTLPDVPIVLVPWGRVWAPSFPRLQDVLTLAGWGNRPLIIQSGDTAFGRVHVPERLFRLDDLMYGDREVPEAMNSVYDRMIAATVHLQTGNRSVFLPRPEGHRRAHPDETGITDNMAEMGLEIVKGWQIPVGNQIAAVSSARVLVGFSGSSLHNSVFAPRGTPVIEILDERAADHYGTERRDLQITLCNLRNQPHIVVPGFARGAPMERHAIMAAVKDVIQGMQ